MFYFLFTYYLCKNKIIPKQDVAQTHKIWETLTWKIISYELKQSHWMIRRSRFQTTVWQLTLSLMRFRKCAALSDISEIRIVSRIRDLLRPRSRRPRRFLRPVRSLWARPWPGRVVEPLSSRFYDIPIGHISGSHIRHRIDTIHTVR